MPTSTDPTAHDKLWDFATPDYSANGPVWFDDDAVVLSGMPGTRGMVTRLDGATGEVKWTTPLHHGAYCLQQVYLSDNCHLFCAWDAVGRVGEQVAAIDGHGVVSLIDPADGKVASTFDGVEKHFVFP